jgi:cell shape-determining protein MreC
LLKIKTAMLIRISLILAVIAALAVGVVNFVFVKDKINTLVTDRNTNRDGWHATQAELAQTNKVLVKTQGDLKQTQQDLADTQADRDKAVANALAQSKRADQLSDQLAKTTQERDDAQNDLAAYKATGLSADQVGKLNRTLKDTQDLVQVAKQEYAVLQHERDRIQNRLDKYEGNSTDVVLRADLKGKIVVVDPKWDFVVLNIGDDQGVKENGELLVSRDGKLVAKVIVRTVEKDRCIANIVPGWKLGEMIEGDEVSPAHPAT